jgi:hypothetical protein
MTVPHAAEFRKDYCVTNPQYDSKQKPSQGWVFVKTFFILLHQTKMSEAA